MSAPPRKGRSLADYIKAKRREACSVCSLPEELIEQIRAARKRRISRDDIIEWLRDDFDVVLTHDQLASHHSAHHDQAA